MYAINQSIQSNALQIDFVSCLCGMIARMTRRYGVIEKETWTVSPIFSRASVSRRYIVLETGKERKSCHRTLISRRYIGMDWKERHPLMFRSVRDERSANWLLYSWRSEDMENRSRRLNERNPGGRRMGWRSRHRLEWVAVVVGIKVLFMLYAFPSGASNMGLRLITTPWWNASS